MDTLRFRYHTHEFPDTDLHLRTLRDRQQFDDPGGKAEALGISPASWPLFGVVWPAGEELAHMMSEMDIEGLRILEVGCGAGLASLRLNQLKADITASDHHPLAGEYLQYNARLNDCPDIPFFRGEWTGDTSEHGLFDLIIGSDLLYERGLGSLLASFIDQHGAATSAVIILDPDRGNANAFSRAMADYGFTLSRERHSSSRDTGQDFKGQALHYRRDG